MDRSLRHMIGHLQFHSSKTEHFPLKIVDQTDPRYKIGAILGWQIKCIETTQHERIAKTWVIIVQTQRKLCFEHGERQWPTHIWSNFWSANTKPITQTIKCFIKKIWGEEEENAIDFHQTVLLGWSYGIQITNIMASWKYKMNPFRDSPFIVSRYKRR